MLPSPGAAAQQHVKCVDLAKSQLYPHATSELSHRALASRPLGKQCQKPNPASPCQRALPAARPGFWMSAKHPASHSPLPQIPAQPRVLSTAFKIDLTLKSHLPCTCSKRELGPWSRRRKGAHLQLGSSAETSAPLRRTVHTNATSPRQIGRVQAPDPSLTALSWS